MFDGTARPSQVIQRRRDRGPCFLRASRCSLQVLRQRIIRGRKKSRQQYGGHDLKNIVCMCIHIYIYYTYIKIIKFGATWYVQWSKDCIWYGHPSHSRKPYNVWVLHGWWLGDIHSSDLTPYMEKPTNIVARIPTFVVHTSSSGTVTSMYSPRGGLMMQPRLFIFLVSPL